MKSWSNKNENNTVFKSLALIGTSLMLVGIAFLGLQFFNQTGNGTQLDSLTPVKVIAQYPEQFQGNHVVISGSPNEQIGYRAFTVNGEGVLKEKILVVSKNPLEPVGGAGDYQSVIAENDAVTIEGNVKFFNLTEIEDEIGFDLDDKEFAAWEGKPVIVADSIKPKTSQN